MAGVGKGGGCLLAMAAISPAISSCYTGTARVACDSAPAFTEVEYTPTALIQPHGKISCLARGGGERGGLGVQVGLYLTCQR